MENFYDYLALSFAVYNTDIMPRVETDDVVRLHSYTNKYEQLIIPNLTDENGYYLKENFACAAYKNGNKVIIAFRGTDDNIDKYVTDLDIALGNIPTVSFVYAKTFYLNLVQYFEDQDIDVEIEFTGHSLGGAIAQLMGSQNKNCKTVTFNAPGMLNMLDQIGCSTTDEYDNITNYSIINDYVGNLRAHAGDTYYYCSCCY